MTVPQLPARHPRLRRAHEADRPRLLDLWERSVRATHDFLEEHDIAGLRPLVDEELASDALDWWVLEMVEGRAIVGLLAVTRGTIEGLFVDPAYHGRGGGSLLVDHAQRLWPGTLAVDVNERNERALGFYQRLGFTVTGRSQTDSGGRPFPILHLTRERAEIQTRAAR